MLALALRKYTDEENIEAIEELANRQKIREMYDFLCEFFRPQRKRPSFCLWRN